MANSTGEAQVNNADEIVGTWALQVSTPFGMQPITLTVERMGDTLSGTMRHERGAADVSNIQMHGPEFTAEAAITLKGSRITADIDGRVAGSEINGTVKVHLPIAPPVKFTGVKQ
jgi:hypothetical protein